MESSAVVIALTVFVTEAIKRFLAKKMSNEDSAKFWAPFCAMVFGALLNMGFVLLLQVTDYQEFWSCFHWREALSEGISIGLQAGGLYGIGKVVVAKSSTINQNW